MNAEQWAALYHSTQDTGLHEALWYAHTQRVQFLDFQKNSQQRDADLLRIQEEMKSLDQQTRSWLADKNAMELTITQLREEVASEKKHKEEQAEKIAKHEQVMQYRLTEERKLLLEEQKKVAYQLLEEQKKVSHDGTRLLEEQKKSVEDELEKERSTHALALERFAAKQAEEEQQNARNADRQREKDQADALIKDQISQLAIDCDTKTEEVKRLTLEQDTKNLELQQLREAAKSAVTEMETLRMYVLFFSHRYKPRPYLDLFFFILGAP